MDEQTFAAAAGRYQDMIYRVALHTLGSAADAEDAAQEVLLRLYTAKNPPTGEEHLRRWLLRVTVNVCRDALRSPWRRRRVPLEDIPAPEFDREEQALLYQAVLGLPEKYRTVLVLFYYEDLPVREIGALLGASPTAVTTRLSRARKLLGERLKGVWRDDE